MQISMTLGTIAALFGVMVILAFIPSVSVLTVSARSAACGFVHGAFATIGIVVGDVIFILLAIFGLAVLADALGGLFILVKYLGGAYLIGLGVVLWRSKLKTIEAEKFIESSLLSSFLAGLFITLGDQKAILFYFGFFPAFIDLSVMTYVDACIIILIASVAVGGVKLGYAYMADQVSVLIHSSAAQVIGIAAGSVLIAVGVFVIARA